MVTPEADPAAPGRAPIARESTPGAHGSSNSRSALTTERLRVETDCSFCDVRAVWVLVADSSRRRVWEREPGHLNAFPCPHWRQHHDAADKLIPQGKNTATVPPVDARVLPC